MTATHAIQFTTTASPVLYMAMELSTKNWKLAFTLGLGQPPRMRSVAAGDIDSLMDEIRKTKVRFGLPDGTPVLSCYEAGLDSPLPAASRDPEQCGRLRIDRGEQAQAPTQIRSPGRREVGVHAGPVALRR
jgi:hypothetical protein